MLWSEKLNIRHYSPLVVLQMAASGVEQFTSYHPPLVPLPMATHPRYSLSPPSIDPQLVYVGYQPLDHWNVLFWNDNDSSKMCCSEMMIASTITSIKKKWLSVTVTWLFYWIIKWRHSEGDGVSHHQRLKCLLNRLIGRRSKKTSKLRVTGLCEGNSLVTGEFPHKGPVTQIFFHFTTSPCLLHISLLPIMAERRISMI